MPENDRELLVEIKGLLLDPNSNVPIVVLKSEERSDLLPIWIGVFEANAIALRIEGVETPRPLTHDLLAGLLGQLDAVIERVVVTELRDNTFYARIHIVHAGRGLEIDSRPSDALALAVRTDAPIYVREQVFVDARTTPLGESLTDEEKMKKWLEDIDPDDLGKYTM